MRVASPQWRQPPLTKEQADDLFMLLLADDTEDAPWMVMGDLQFWSAAQFAASLRSYAHHRQLPWYVASMLPIQFIWPRTGSKRTLAPDVFVAFVPERARTSYDVETEGQFPSFVLEVVSPSSTARDQIDKRQAYELLGAQEYALFTPRDDGSSSLEGYRLSPARVYDPWPLDAAGQLSSEVLGLNLVVQGTLLRAQTPDGRFLPTLEEAESAQRQAESAQRQAESAQRRSEAARAEEAEARLAAEADVERLRGEIERYRHNTDQDRRG